MSEERIKIAELDQLILKLRAELDELTNQAAAASGERAEESIAEAISDKEVQLAAMQRRRDKAAEEVAKEEKKAAKSAERS